MSKLNIAEVLTAIDGNIKEYYDALEPEQQKEISPWVLMRYASSADKYVDHYLVLVNECVNTNYSALSKHPKLLWQLLCVCGVGKKVFHPWIPPGKRQKSKIDNFLLSVKPLLNSQELSILKETLSVDDMICMAKDYGYTDKEIDEIFKEAGAKSGKEKSKK